MKIYSYIRVSSADQNEDRQIVVMNDLNISLEKIFTDSQSGQGF